MTLRVLIANERPLMLAGLRLALEHGDLDIVAEASSAEQAHALAAEARPDVLLLDTRLAGTPPLFHPLAELAAAAPDALLLLLGGPADAHLAAQALEQAGNGYIADTIHPADLPALIRQAAAGQIRLAAPPNPLAHLTPRERVVLDQIGRGLTNRQIAHELGITEAGAKFHVSKTLRKLGLKSRTEAAAYLSKPTGV